jgi:hypothetical protein
MILTRQRLVVPDGTGPLDLPSLVLEWAWGSDVTVPIQLVHASGAPYDLSGAVAMTLTFKRRASDASPLLSRALVITDAFDGLGYFQVLRGDRGLLLIGSYAVGFAFEDDDTGFRDAVAIDSRANVLDPVAQITDPVSVPPAQTPLAQGPPGVRWLGPWSGSTQYEPRDGVQYADPNGGGGTALSSFLALNPPPTLGVPPLTLLGAVNAGWSYLSERGAQGAAGATGATGPTGPAGPAGSGVSYAHVAALRAGTEYQGGLTFANVLGYYAAGDHGGVSYIFDSASTLTDDGGAVIKPTAVGGGAGRWLLQVTHPLNPKWWGAKDDATLAFDSYPAFQAVLDYVDRVLGISGFPPGMSVRLPTGQYRSSQTLNINRPIVWEGEGKSSTIIFFQNAFPGPGTPIDGFKLQKQQDIPGAPSSYDASFARVRHLSIIGDGHEYTFFAPPDPLLSEFDPLTPGQSSTGHPYFPGCGVLILAHAGIVEDCNIAGFFLDAVHVEAAETPNANGWAAKDIFVTSCGRHGLFATGDNGNAGRGVGLDVNACAGWGVYDRSFLGNHFDGCQTAENGVWIRDVLALHVDPNAYRGGQPYSLIVGARQGGTYWTADQTAWVGQNVGLQNLTDLTGSNALRLAAITTLADDGVTFYAGSGAVNVGFAAGGAFTRLMNSGPGGFWASQNTGLSNLDVRALACNGVAGLALAGTVGGGVFKTTNSGVLWAASNTGLGTLDVRALISDPATPTTFYAGTNGGKVYKSTDSGATWTQVPTGFTSSNVLSLAMVSGALYAGCDDGKIFTTTNGGASWTDVSPAGNTHSVQCLAIDPTNNAKLIAGTGGAGIYRTSNSGASWTQSNTGLVDPQNGNPITDVRAALADPSGNFLIGVIGQHYLVDLHNNGGVFKSTDSGATWDNTMSQALRYGGGYSALGLGLSPCTFVGCYAESDQNEWIQPPAMVIGGVLAFEAGPFPGSRVAAISPQIGGIVGLGFTGQPKELTAVVPTSTTGLNVLDGQYEGVTSYFCNSGGSNQTVVLINPVSFPGTTIYIQKVNSTSTQVLVNGNIEGGGRTIPLNLNGDFIQLKSDGTTWRIMDSRGVYDYRTNEVLLPFLVADSNAFGFVPNFQGNYLVSVYYRVVTAPTDVQFKVTWTDAAGAQSKIIESVLAQAIGSYIVAPIVVNCLGNGFAAINVLVTESTSNQVYLSAAVKQI